jgi:hypothetical protein
MSGTVGGLLPLDWAGSIMPINEWVDPEPQRYQGE